MITTILAQWCNFLPTLAAAAAGGGEHGGEGGKSEGSKWILEHVYDSQQLDLFHFLGIHLELPRHLGITKHTVFMFLAAALTFLTVWTAARSIDRVPSGLRNALEAVVKFLRDDVIYPNMGVENGRRFMPFLLTLFLFILIMNLLGMVPFGAAATGNIFVTGALALITLSCMIIGGMIAQGPFKFWVNLVPHGVPAAIWPILFVIELIGLFIKPFALMIRLCANMMAGHIVIFSIMSFIFTFATLWYVIAPASVLAIVLFSLLELLVALIQAYVFTMLSAVFIGMSLHPEH